MLASCNSADLASAKPGNRRPLYFDVKGLLDAQIKLLAAQHPGTSKRVMLRDGTQEAVRVPQVKWADELQIFYQADINKAALRGAYAEDSAALPGGLTRRTYTRRTEQANAPVTKLVVLKAGEETQQVEATIEQHNPLFDTHKKLKFSLQQNRLTSYEVRGSQKLILFDTLRYAAAGKVD